MLRRKRAATRGSGREARAGARDATKAASANGRHVPAGVSRAVWARDGERCAFVGPAGRCTEVKYLELHHRIPWVLGGPTRSTTFGALPAAQRLRSGAGLRSACSAADAGRRHPPGANLVSQRGLSRGRSSGRSRAVGPALSFQPQLPPPHPRCSTGVAYTLAMPWDVMRGLGIAARPRPDRRPPARERGVEARRRADVPPGTLLGAVCALLAPPRAAGSWPRARRRRRRDRDGQRRAAQPEQPDPGITTEVALLLMYARGRLRWSLGHRAVAVVLGGTVAVLLPLQGGAARLRRRARRPRAAGDHAVRPAGPGRAARAARRHLRALRRLQPAARCG